MCSLPTAVPTWGPNDLDFGRPIAAPLRQCADLLGVDVPTIRGLAANAAAPARAYGTRRGGYIDHRRSLAGDT
jgi:hypothetical protein